MSKYNREEVIAKLSRNGLVPMYGKKSGNLYGFSNPKKITVGLKQLGYLDFLGVKIIKNKI